MSLKCFCDIFPFFVLFHKRMMAPKLKTTLIVPRWYYITKLILTILVTDSVIQNMFQFKIQIRSKIQIRQFSNKYFWIISYLSNLIWMRSKVNSSTLHLDIFNWINLMEQFLYRLVIDSLNENVYLNTYVKCAYDKITWRLKHFIFHHDTDT